MYGTIARLTVTPGKLEELREQNQLLAEELTAAGIVFEHIFQSTTDPNEIWMVVAFSDQAAYQRNAESPEQHERYGQLRAMLDADPEWHDGHVIESFPA